MKNRVSSSPNFCLNTVFIFLMSHDPFSKLETFVKLAPLYSSMQDNAVPVQNH